MMRAAVFVFVLGATASCAQSPTPAAKPRVVEHVTVTADRGLVGVDDAAASVAVLNADALAQHGGFTLDDALRQVAGFQLFRRTSSWTANPTSQGVSLRGLGSTAASRTLVVSDNVPLNDPFGGWVHWNEIPLLAIDHVELLRGGAADLYGSSAIGGVVNIVSTNTAPRETSPRHAGEIIQLRGDAAGATEDTAQEDGLLTLTHNGHALLGAASGLRTNGYIPTAPALRGAVDGASNLRGESGRVELGTTLGPATHAFLRGNLLNEARGNGTPLQTNATRLWRFGAGVDADSERLGHSVVRAFGARENYRQSFSAIAADRNTEKLTRLQRVPTDELGVALTDTRAFAAHVTAAAGLDIRDVRAHDDESAVSAGVITNTVSSAARQRAVGGYADAIWQPRGWSASASVRVDSFRTFDALQTQTASNVRVPLPELDELFVSPRVGLVRSMRHALSISAGGFRAFRGPTMNELYRTGQVAQQTTLANNSLLAERATGFETGVQWTPLFASVRASYFWTEVNRPISAVLQSQTPATQTLLRENLGQIRSRGLMLEAQMFARRGVSASLSYQCAVATVTKFNPSATIGSNLLGNWIPQVPRQSVAAQLGYASERAGTLRLETTYNGRQFEDAENQFTLHGFARFDLYAEHEVRNGLSIFASVQNLLDRSIEAGRTPLLTLAAPRVVEAGVRFRIH